MFRSYFRRVRMQPKEVRDRHAFIIASIFTASIAGVWVFTQLQLEPDNRQQVAAETATPFSNLIDQVKDQWASVQQALPEVETEVSTSTREEIDLSPTSLQLESTNLSEVRADLEAAQVWDGVGSVATSSAERPTYEEVQIVVVSASGTTSTVPLVTP